MAYCDTILLGKSLSNYLLESAHVGLVETPRYILFAIWAFALFILIWLLIVRSISLFKGWHRWDSNDFALRRDALLRLIASRLVFDVRHQILEVATALPKLNWTRVQVQLELLVAMVGLDDLTGNGSPAGVNRVRMIPKEAVLLPCDLKVSLGEAALIKQALAAT